MKKGITALVNFSVGAALVLAVWQIAHLALSVNVLPSPFVVLRALPALLGQDIFTHAYHSFYRIGMALLFSMLIGLIVGIAAAGKGVFAKVLTPFLYFTYPIPRVALLPAVMLIFGLTDAAKIIMITIIVVYPIIVVVRDSVKDIPKQTYNTLTCYGAGRVQVFLYITLPWALGGILSTARISLGTAISILFFVEAYGARRGMGFFILDAWMRLNYVQMYAGIVVLSMAGFALFVLIDIIEGVFMKWKG
ncbi:MAG: ABC transporter permease subunit [Oscillospiraceae bacterium]|nr:ABC transporter permease subunit [Oscillospiraceae bacterium]